MRNPFVTNAFVCGPGHYGRGKLLAHLLDSGPAHWVIGSRRMGKTSLLRQLEHLANDRAALLPLYWDMRDSGTFAALGAHLAEAVREAGPRFESAGLTPPAGETGDAVVLLSRLRRLAHQAGKELLLLCDEAGVLVDVARRAPKAMQRLQAELTQGNGIRTVIVSGPAAYQLYEVCRDWPTQPFLAGFDMSQLLGCLDEEEARALVWQRQATAPLQATPHAVTAICSAANRHPYLLQLLCVRLFREDGTLRAPADEDFAAAPATGDFFLSDLRALGPVDRQLVWAVHRGEAGDEPALAERLGLEPALMSQRLGLLERFGLVRTEDGAGLAPGSKYLRGWLRTPEARALLAPDEITPESEAALGPGAVPGRRGRERAARLVLRADSFACA